DAGGQGIAPFELVRYLVEAAEAVDYLHAKGILHCDIKPDNLLLVRDQVRYHVRLADFGVARLLEGTVQGPISLVGTPPYIAPEVWKDRPGPASDQYALAVSYIELRLGRRPFRADHPYAYAVSHLKSDPDLAGLSEPEQAVLRKALARNPADRY